MKYSFYIFLVFVSGMNVCANLIKLIPTNAYFEAAWHKVFFAIVLAIMFAYIANEK